MSGSAIDYVPSWQLRLRGRLFDQFKSLPNWQALSDLIASRFQPVEDALQQLATINDIGDGIRTDVTGQTIGIGAQLDRIGTIVGQVRAGAVDTDYRYYLRARIATNKSSGDPESIYRVFVAMFGGAAKLVTRRSDVASLTLTILNYPITATVAAIAVSFLRDAKVAGVRAILEYQFDPSTLLFTLAPTAFLTAQVNPGDTLIAVDSTAGFGPSGVIRLNFGEVNSEVLGYTSLTSTTITISAASVIHAVDSPVGFYIGPNRGFDDQVSPGIGGRFTGALQA